MRYGWAGALLFGLMFGAASTSAAQDITGVATAAAASSCASCTGRLEHQRGQATVSLERDDQGRWQRVETTRVELERIRRRSRRYRVSLYKAPSDAHESALRVAGQKLANRERGTVAIVYASGSQIMAFSPARVAVPAASNRPEPQAQR